MMVESKRFFSVILLYLGHTQLQNTHQSDTFSTNFGDEIRRGFSVFGEFFDIFLKIEQNQRVKDVFYWGDAPRYAKQSMETPQVVAQAL